MGKGNRGLIGAVVGGAVLVGSAIAAKKALDSNPKLNKKFKDAREDLGVLVKKEVEKIKKEVKKFSKDPKNKEAMDKLNEIRSMFEEKVKMIKDYDRKQFDKDVAKARKLVEDLKKKAEKKAEKKVGK